MYVTTPAEHGGWGGSESVRLEFMLMEKKVLREGIKRLRTAHQEDAQEDYKEGLRTGQEWACEDARPGHLRMLAQAVADAGTGGKGILVVDEKPSVTIFRMMESYPPDETLDPADYWECVLGAGWRYLDNVEFAAGFVDGARALWAEVKEYVEAV
jgi:hypothetical protein